MSRRSKEIRQKRLRPQRPDREKGRGDYTNPHAENELEGQKFKHSAKEIKFRGQTLPAYFEIWVSETQKLYEDQEIGKTRFGQKLLWRGGSVVTKG